MSENASKTWENVKTMRRTMAVFGRFWVHGRPYRAKQGDSVLTLSPKFLTFFQKKF